MIDTSNAPATAGEPVLLDLGAGSVSPAGFRPLGNVNGTQIFPLPCADGSVDVIRASHVLEHFPHGQVLEVLKDWVRALKPGGQLRIAVPDFSKLADLHRAGHDIEPYLMGGQVDGADHHHAMFHEKKLRVLLNAAGLMLIDPWTSELQDCAALPISLNLAGVKPHQELLAVSAVMSVPRLGFMDNFYATFEALPALNVKLRRATGAYWGQCLERIIELSIKEDRPDAILTLDYDTVYTRRDAARLLQLMHCHPEADAIAAVQYGRGIGRPLFAVHGQAGADGQVDVKREDFAARLLPVGSAHFGLTLFRADKFAKLARPWFLDVPDASGGWGPGRRDADIDFWRKWEAAGNSLYLANRIAVGHLELSVLWPGEDLQPIYQPIHEWRETSAPPPGVWR